VRKRAFLDEYQPDPHHQNYLPVVVPLPGTVKHSAKKLSIATIAAPQQVCGIAQRVGYTGTRETDLALYRLKVRTGSDLAANMLPGFFVLENGIFHTYER